MSLRFLAEFGSYMALETPFTALGRLSLVILVLRDFDSLILKSRTPCPGKKLRNYDKGRLSMRNSRQLGSSLEENYLRRQDFPRSWPIGQTGEKQS